MQAWQVHEYGRPGEVLKLGEIAVPTPAPHQILVRVEAIAINFNDLDGIHGRYRTVKPPLPFVPGMEVLGHVESCGEGAENWLGKRVCTIPDGAFGGYAEYAVCPTAMTFEMPGHIDVAEAASLYYPFHLASLALFERGKLQPGETALIHAAAGGVGSAAIQLAKNAGARVIVTAGSDQKLALCQELGADNLINYRTSDFADEVNVLTEGRGADIILDSVGGAVTEDSLRCLAFNGRLMILGFASGIEAEDESAITPRPLLFGNFSLCGVCHAYVDDPIEFRKLTGLNFPSHSSGVAMHEEILTLFAKKKIRAVVGQQVTFNALPDVFDAIESRTSVGRSIVVLDH
tara:strand:+ start:2305 stop:3342 length:1038 start_codon:yes stop_codon:yes gene_type:complete